jgi:hypothetical protein
MRQHTKLETKQYQRGTHAVTPVRMATNCPLDHAIGTLYFLCARVCLCEWINKGDHHHHHHRPQIRVRASVCWFALTKGKKLCSRRLLSGDAVCGLILNNRALDLSCFPHLLTKRTTISRRRMRIRRSVRSLELGIRFPTDSPARLHAKLSDGLMG